MIVRRPLSLLLPLVVLAAAPAGARPPGSWGSPFGGADGWGRGWGEPPLGSRWGEPRPANAPDSREGKVDVDSFIADGARARLGHGNIALVTDAEEKAEVGDPLTDKVGDQLPYQAAVIDQLVKAGYDTQTPKPTDGQIVELRFHRETLVPEEQKRKPVSGEASIGVSNWGTSYGMAVAVDLTKPKKALISTRMDVQIKDLASNATLWEGHASIATREGDTHWTDQAIAVRLAAALFDDFPNASTAVLASR